MTPAQCDMVLAKASVPEHSVPFMQAVSGGTPFVEGAYLFFSSTEQLLAIGYPLDGPFSWRAFEDALSKALRRTRARSVSTICETLPARLAPHCCACDRYYLRSATTPPMNRLERIARQAAGRLRVQKSTRFTPAHQRLWAEFTGRQPLPSDVYQLYARTPEALGRTPQLTLFNAWDHEGHLAACLLVDCAPKNFLSYLLGAHSRSHYTPHASDLLFLEMLAEARRLGKAFLHLGLGVNPGIRRFKTKWGGQPGPAYEMARWRIYSSAPSPLKGFRHMLAVNRQASLSKRKILAELPYQRRLAMLWEVRQDGHLSYIGGTAHFFRYSFTAHLQSLLEDVDTVLFEGPLDAVSLDEIATIGRAPEAGSPRLADCLGSEEISILIRMVCGPGGLGSLFSAPAAMATDEVRHLLVHARHWLAFFAIWSAFLARRGWKQSVDLEAWNLARRLNKVVCGMERIDEQIRTLEEINVEKAAAFLRRCREWPRFSRRFEALYLQGDLNRITTETTMFPTRTGRVIARRDTLFVERMLPFLKKGPCMVLVGTPHLINIRPMLTQAGYVLRRVR